MMHNMSLIIRCLRGRGLRPLLLNHDLPHLRGGHGLDGAEALLHQHLVKLVVDRTKMQPDVVSLVAFVTLHTFFAVVEMREFLSDIFDEMTADHMSGQL